MMFLTALLLTCALVASHPIPKTTSSCEPGKTCYSYPENCEMEDCQAVLSFGKTTTDLYARVDPYWQVIIYNYKNKVLNETSFACFALGGKCMYGSEKIGEQYKKNQNVDYVKVTQHQIGEDSFTVHFPEIVIPRGDDMSYAFRIEAAATILRDPVYLPLYPVTGSKAPGSKNARSIASKASSSNASAAEASSNVSTAEGSGDEMTENFEDILEDGAQRQKRVVDVDPSIKLVNFNDVFADMLDF